MPMFASVFPLCCFRVQRAFIMVKVCVTLMHIKKLYPNLPEEVGLRSVTLDPFTPTGKKIVSIL